MITFCIKKSERFCHLNVKFSFSPLQIFEISFQIFEITLQIFNISLQIFEISLQIFEISLQIFEISFQIFEISFQIFEISFQIFEIPPPLKLYILLLEDQDANPLVLVPFENCCTFWSLNKWFYWQLPTCRTQWRTERQRSRPTTRSSTRTCKLLLETSRIKQHLVLSSKLLKDEFLKSAKQINENPEESLNYLIMIDQLWSSYTSCYMWNKY